MASSITTPFGDLWQALLSKKSSGTKDGYPGWKPSHFFLLGLEPPTYHILGVNIDERTNFLTNWVTHENKCIYDHQVDSNSTVFSFLKNSLAETIENERTCYNTLPLLQRLHTYFHHTTFKLAIYTCYTVGIKIFTGDKST